MIWKKEQNNTLVRIENTIISPILVKSIINPLKLQISYSKLAFFYFQCLCFWIIKDQKGLFYFKKKLKLQHENELHFLFFPSIISNFHLSQFLFLQISYAYMYVYFAKKNGKVKSIFIIKAKKCMQGKSKSLLIIHSSIPKCDTFYQGFFYSQNCWDLDLATMIPLCFVRFFKTQCYKWSRSSNCCYVLKP